MRHASSGRKKTVRLAATPPTGMPMYAIAMLALRDLTALESIASAIKLGIAPPSPSPVRNRAAVNHVISGATDVKIEKKPNAAIEATSTDFRPTRSEIRPPTAAPRRRPAPLALKKSPSACGVGRKRWLTPAAATPAA